MSAETFFFGQWQVEPAGNTLRLGTHIKQLEPKAMDVLLLLCQHAGQVLSSEDIVNHCWPNTDVGDNPLHKIINQLRRALGDSATHPTYIETIRKRGYRTLADVQFPLGHEANADEKSWQQGSPFPGLQAYSGEYATVFFGRSEQISTLLKRIKQQIQFGRAFCLILGPSGSGKSSLINAGIMPNLLTDNGFNGIHVTSFSSLDLADVIKDQLFTELACAMLDWEINNEPVFAGYSADSLGAALQHEPHAIISLCQQALPKKADCKVRFALFIDRLEVLLSSPLFSEEERTHAIATIELLATSNAVLVISACRNDFYPLLVNYPSLMAGKARGAHFDLAPPTRTELLQMIRLPAVAANLSWEMDTDTAMPLDEMLCSDAASNPDALPMLQYTLQALYLQRSDDNKLLVSVYHTLGGIEGAIGKNAEQAMFHLRDAEKASLPRILSLLVTLREDEKSITSRSARWSQLQSSAETALVQAMVDSRLFVSHLQNGEPCFSIAHEALLRRWPRATAWISEHSDSLSIKSRLQHLSTRWLSEAKHSAYLLADGKPLKEAQSLSQNPLFDLEEPETVFISASTKRANMLRWTRRLTVTLLCVLTLTSIIMSVRSIEAEKLALQKRLAAEDLLGFMVGDFADKMRGIGRMDLLDGISNKALEYFSDFSNKEDDAHLSFDARFQHGQTLEAMGEVAYSRNKIDEAHSALLAAQEKMLPLLSVQPENLALLKTLGANAFWLGQLKYDVSDWVASRPYFEQYLAYSQTMYALAPEDKDALMELSYAHNSLGSISMNLLEFTKAQDYFEQSLTLKLLALAALPNDSQLIADVADTRSWLASSMLASGNLQLGIKIYEEIIRDLERANDDKNNLYLTDILSVNYFNLARLYRFGDNHKLTKDTAMKSFRLLENLTKTDNANQTWKIRFLKLKFDLLDIQNIDDRLSTNEFIFPQKLSAELDHEIRKETTSQRFSALLPLFHLSAARYYQLRGMDALSAEHLTEASIVNDTFIQALPGEVEYQYNAAIIALLKTNDLQRQGKLDDIHRLCTLAKNRLSPLLLNKDPKYIAPYADSLRCLGELDTQTQLTELLNTQQIKLSLITTQPQGMTNVR